MVFFSVCDSNRRASGCSQPVLLCWDNEIQLITFIVLFCCVYKTDLYWNITRVKIKTIYILVRDTFHDRWHHYDHFTIVFRSESAKKLDILAKKLQPVQDIDELTKMVLRGGKKHEMCWHCLQVLYWLICLFLRSSALPVSTRKGRWSAQPSERSETSSSKASPAVWWRHGLLSRWCTLSLIW